MLAKGTVELDGNGDLLSANFPVFAISDGDKASLQGRSRPPTARCGSSMRGDVYDGRNFVKAAMAGPSDPKIKARQPDLDLDIKIGAVAGHITARRCAASNCGCRAAAAASAPSR